MKAVGIALCLMAALGLGYLVGVHRPDPGTLHASKSSLEQEMDDRCTAKLNIDYLSKFNADERKGMTTRSFYSRKLHTCVLVDVFLDPKNAAAMNYTVSDFTYGFIAAPKWHPYDSPLHVSVTNYGRFRHLYAEGYWASSSSDPGQQLATDANAVKLTCDYTEGSRANDESNSCTETNGYIQTAAIRADSQEFHIASWNADEIIATDAERGLSGSTTSTLIIHPGANEIEVVDRTKMDEKQTTFTKGMAGKSSGGHYELHGGMYLIDTQATFFQCDEDGVVNDMRIDVVAKHNGDVVNVLNSEWNSGTKADHKFTQHECETAMQRKLQELQ